jgi:hypothetical protein
MIRIFMISLLGFVMVECGENNDKKTVSSDLAQLENDWMHAMMKRDRSFLDQVVAPEFTVTGIKYMDSAAVTRTVWMTNVMQDLTIDSVHFINTKVSTIGDIGIVRAQFYWSGTYGQDRFSDTTSFIDTWVKRNGDWRVVSRVMAD